MVAWLRWIVESIGYWFRPYDMLADRRRWRWQRPQRCGLPPMKAKDWEQLRDVLARLPEPPTGT